MEITGLIITILWGLMSMLIMVQYAPYCKDLSEIDKWIVGFIFLIGGPILVAANVIEAILDCILPEGWGNDDDGPWKY